MRAAGAPGLRGPGAGGAASCCTRCPWPRAATATLTVACFSVAMLLYEKGKQYTLSELEEMLGVAGFVEFESAGSHGYYHLISARKPQ